MAFESALDASNAITHLIDKTLGLESFNLNTAKEDSSRLELCSALLNLIVTPTSSASRIDPTTYRTTQTDRDCLLHSLSQIELNDHPDDYSIVTLLSVDPVSKQLHCAPLFQYGDFQHSDRIPEDVDGAYFNAAAAARNVVGVDIEWNQSFCRGKGSNFKFEKHLLVKLLNLKRNASNNTLLGLILLTVDRALIDVPQGQHRIFGDIVQRIGNRKEQQQDEAELSPEESDIGIECMLFLSIHNMMHYVFLTRGRKFVQYDTFNSMKVVLNSNAVTGPHRKSLEHAVTNISVFALTDDFRIRNDFIINPIRTYFWNPAIISPARLNAIKWVRFLQQNYFDRSFYHELSDPEMLNFFQFVSGKDRDCAWLDTERQRHIFEGLKLVLNKTTATMPMKVRIVLIADIIKRAIAKTPIVGIYKIDYNQMHEDPEVCSALQFIGQT